MRMRDWMLPLCLALAAPLAVAAAVAHAEGAPPATTPAGTQPATPGGGNPNANSENAATPAVPPSHEHDLDVDHLDDATANDLSARHPEVGQEAKARWEAMTPDERKAWCQAHPRLARAIVKLRWEEMTPPERADFCRTHPEVRRRIIERWQGMTPAQRQEFLRRHPQVRRRMAARRLSRERSNNGVRDHGAGEGRNGVGQGGEHRPAPRPGAGR